MKKLLAAFAAVAFAAPIVVSAQTRPADRPVDRSAREAAKDTRPTWKNDAGLHESRTLVGMRVKSETGKDLGEIDNLLIDPSAGKITHVVIGYGGLVGVGEKKVVVPWSDIKMGAVQDGKKTAVIVEQAKLDSAPRWDKAAARADVAPAASPSTKPPSMKDSDKDGKRDSADKAPYDPTRK
jgi:sporulation protein YlmC with PRC-barrel domain